jgi:hypothetical protein
MSDVSTLETTRIFPNKRLFGKHVKDHRLSAPKLMRLPPWTPSSHKAGCPGLGSARNTSRAGLLPASMAEMNQELRTIRNGTWPARLNLLYGCFLVELVNALPIASRGAVMDGLEAAFNLLFGCHHRNLSRVFTIQGRTYCVCCDCGMEFNYSLKNMSIEQRVRRDPMLTCVRIA